MRKFKEFMATAQLSARSLQREFRTSRLRWFFIFFFVCFGFSATLSVANIKNSLEDSILKQSQAFLGADFAVSSRRDLGDREWALLAQEVGAENVSHLVEVYSMVTSPTRARLMQIRVIDELFPFYGHIQLSPFNRPGDSKSAEFKIQRQQLLSTPSCWVYPEVLVQLKVKPGSVIKIAGKEFVIAGVVTSDSANTLAGIDLAPRIYMGENQAETTDLMATGSTQWHSYLIKKRAASDDQMLRAQIEKVLPAKELRIYSHREAGESAQRLMSYLQDYLSLSSLTVLLFALVATWFVLKLDLLKAQSTLYTQHVLGRSMRALFLERAFLYTGLFFIAYWASEALSVMFLNLASPFFKSFTQLNFSFVWSPRQILSRASFAVFISLFFLFPLLQANFRENSLKPPRALKSILSWVPFILLIGFLVREFSQSVKLSLAYTIGICLLYLLFWSTGLGILALVKICQRKLKRSAVTLKLALQTLVGRKSESLLVFVTLGFAFCFVFALGHLQKTLLHQIQFGSSAQKPSLFLFDIQDHQLKALEAQLAENRFTFLRVSPLIRGRVISHNGQAQIERVNAEQANKDSEEEAQTKNRGYNLSYRDRLDESETVIEGAYPLAPYQLSQSGLPEFSAEEKFAERMGWKLKDIVEFEVLGVPIRAQLTSVRRINWTSFQPNFFVQFQPGVLDEVPKTYIASLAPLSVQKKEEAQNLLAEHFPNVSVIDVTNLIDRIADLSKKLALTLQVMGYLCSILGVVLLLSILSVQSVQNRSDLVLFEQLGLIQKRGQMIFIGQRLLLLFLTFILASALSLLAAEVISWKLFSSHVKVNTATLMQVFGVTLLFYALFEMFERLRLQRQKPSNLDA